MSQVRRPPLHSGRYRRPLYTTNLDATEIGEIGASGLPGFFEEALAGQYPADDVARILAGSAAKRPVTLRANALLSDRDEVAGALDAAGIPWRRVSFYDDAFILDSASEREVWDLPIYQDGKVYLQSLSSMIPALVLDARAGEDVCDMCAAPGGKTTQIAALAGKGALITACELHAPRAEKLEHNLRKLGARNVTVMRTDARRLDDFFSFDRILLDAPCSGSGTLRAGDAKTATRFKPTLVEKSRKSQRALFSKALSMLKAGGTLVYSTCSVLACENEEIVEEGMRKARKIGVFEIEPVERPGFEDLPTLPTSIDGALALCPTDLYEGFFVVKIKRKA